MSSKKPVTILAIETSCDETAASVLRGVVDAKNPSFKALSNVVRSQIKIHSKFGGVVPEVAARAHVKAIRPVVEKALSDAFPKLSTSHSALSTYIDYIAVTSGPGLMPSLLVGVEFAKGLSFATGIPLIATNHMEGHLYSPFGESMPNVSNFAKASSDKQFLISKGRQSPAGTKMYTPKVAFPILSLIVSGKHTTLVVQKNESHYKALGDTVDDAAGEAFDKVAKLLDLPYPGGPQISKLAEQGEAVAQLPRPMIHDKSYDFSFSGLKTAVLYYLQSQHPNPVPPLSKGRLGGVSTKANLHNQNFGHIPEKDKANLARSFEEAVVDVLVTKTMRAAKQYNCKTISLSGGVAANKRLRSALAASSSKLKADFIVPDFRLCTDNAEMIALASYFKLRAGYKPVTYKKVTADSNWELK